MDKGFLLNWMSQILKWLKIDSADGGYESLAATCIVILVCFLLWRLLRLVLLRTARLKDKVSSTQTKLIFDKANMKKIAFTIAVIIFYVLMPLAFPADSDLGRFVKKLLDITLVLIFTSLINNAVKTIFELIYNKRKATGRPLKGIMQILQILLWCIGIIIIMGILVNKSPAKLLTGLGASVAVLSFVFKDTILNLVSGILLSNDKMVKVGDWIEMPSNGIDGTVIDMGLNTIKIRNWDNTISNITPYGLTSGTFKNWQGMVQSGGRRIARYVEIDINSVKFCSEELLHKIGSTELMKDFLPSDKNRHQQITNLELFRTYIVRYMKSQKWLNNKMTCMVRHLQSSDTGAPLQIYAFTNTTVWNEYENIQSALFEHIMAIAPLFEVRIFQRPSGNDLEKRNAFDEVEHSVN